MPATQPGSRKCPQLTYSSMAQSHTCSVLHPAYGSVVISLWAQLTTWRLSEYQVCRVQTQVQYFTVFKFSYRSLRQQTQHAEKVKQEHCGTLCLVVTVYVSLSGGLVLKAGKHFFKGGGARDKKGENTLSLTVQPQCIPASQQKKKMASQQPLMKHGHRQD